MVLDFEEAIVEVVDKVELDVELWEPVDSGIEVDEVKIEDSVGR